jgi:hypothetical protein
MAIGVVASLFAVGVALPAGALTKTQLHAKALVLADLPSGWTVDHSSSSGVSGTGCLKGLGRVPKHATRVAVAYTHGQFPSIQETLETGQGSLARFRAYRHELASCHHLSLNADRQHINATIRPVTLATGVPGSSTYEISFKVQKQSFAFEIALFQLGNIVASFGYAHTGDPDPTQMLPFVTAAIEKIKSA